jgi:hypothetical protein
MDPKQDRRRIALLKCWPGIARPISLVCSLPSIANWPVGDVHAHVYKLREAHTFASTPLILGEGDLQRQRVRIEMETVEAGSVLVMFTDGLKSRTTLKGQLDVLRRPPIAIAQHLLETCSRPDDDALVLVARFTS